MTRSAALLARTDQDAWWRDAVIYQIYPRSFADADGDGIGDLPGIRARVPHLVDLGVDAVWLSPFYPSPQVDAGYDVSDYFDVAPEYGTLEDFDALVADLHQAGIRVVVDLVPNHTSDRHEWFRAALEAGPGSRERDRYLFRRSPGAAPNNWGSLFGGPAWQQVEPLTGRGQDRDWWYLHLFAAEQPDLNWDNEEVREYFRRVLRFWVERGVDGFRVDVAHSLVKAEGLPDDEIGPDRWRAEEDAVGESPAKQPDVGPAFNQPGVHEVYREWRSLLDTLAPDILLVAEAWVQPEEEAARYVRADEMSQAFNFAFLQAGWDAARMRQVIDSSLRANDAVGAPTTWVLSNHDVVRHMTRFAYPPGTRTDLGIGAGDPQPDTALGLRRARGATVFMLGLPGSAYLYQGEELGLPEHTTMEDSARQDPTWSRTGHVVRGRDGCRVPLPWSQDGPAYGFNDTGRSWLPQPQGWGEYAPGAQEGKPASTLGLYRRTLRLRRELGLGRGGVSWQEAPEGVLSLRNGATAVVLNTTDTEIPFSSLGGSGRLVLTSWGEDEGQAADGLVLPAGSACWLQSAESPRAQ
ncbi:alpha-amylase [Actinomyces sp. 2119]|uniref:glycoside hydrolase family 13 protein n=1 Tax=Actinomyces sp. 2119 TaxID=2321393 RepID=UPI000E6C892A|nr:glycoside hydrolase family 13 protein [Actinomyces sp. 2119]RJF43138.1 alpha-amylase [Actinomyces sp. 2119]